MIFDLRPNGQELMLLAEKNAHTYQNNSPFPHIVLDNLFDKEKIKEILDEFPDEKAIDWRIFDDETGVKLASKNENQLGIKTFHLINVLNSGTFLRFLEALTGIEKLISDPYLFGGGLHQIKRGGYLKMHVDYNKHNYLPLDRRVNLLLYLNEDWEESFGGAIELWDEDMKTCAQKILPLFNRMVLFSTTDKSFHGHPEPLTCPSDRTRKSIALYYFSVGRPEAEVSTLHSTIYEARPGEKLLNVKSIIKQLVPPILLNIIRKKPL
jgi:Rps23 Pro-64 3,4-dihydroxylase Tpa1-like proline 4-hydroxylase